MGGERFVDAAEQPDTDLQHLENPERVQAWRRGLGGKRMYDFFGLKRGAITIWDRIGKISDDPAARSEADQETLADPVFGAAHRAIKEHRGADALAILELVLYGPRPVDDAETLAAPSGPAVQILRAPVVDIEGRSTVRAVAIMIGRPPVGVWPACGRSPVGILKTPQTRSRQGLPARTRTNRRNRTSPGLMAASHRTITP